MRNPLFKVFDAIALVFTKYFKYLMSLILCTMCAAVWVAPVVLIKSNWITSLGSVLLSTSIAISYFFWRRERNTSSWYDVFDECLYSWLIGLAVMFGSYFILYQLTV